jgi:starch phosphorylase
MMKASLLKLCPMFNTHRMVEEYWDRFYLPAAERGTQLMERDGEDLKQLASWREKIMYNWGNVAIKDIQMESVGEVEVGGAYHVETNIFLGELLPEDVMVEAYYGRLGPSNGYVDRFTQIMDTSETVGDHIHRYQCVIFDLKKRAILD